MQAMRCTAPKLSGIRALVAKAGYTLNPAPSTLHPEPCTLNPAPSTLHPQPCTLNSTPSTLYPEPSILNPQPYIPNPKPQTLNRNGRFNVSQSHIDPQVPSTPDPSP